MRVATYIFETRLFQFSSITLFGREASFSRKMFLKGGGHESFFLSLYAMFNFTIDEFNKFQR